MNTLYSPDFTGGVLSDVPTVARSAGAVALTSKTVTASTFDAADVVFPSVPDGEDIVAFLVYNHTTGMLIGMFYDFANLPLTPDGRDGWAIWSDGLYRIFYWGGP